MTSLFVGIFVALVGLAAMFVIPLQTPVFGAYRKVTGLSVMALGALLSIGGALGYNDAGYCVHIRTAYGVESSKCDLGWYVLGWGMATQYPHYITITNTDEADGGGSAVSNLYRIRMADNWTGDIAQTTRFGIPNDPEQFLKMARDFRSPERLITTTLRPAVTSSLDSIASLFSMEEYWGGKRDEFKTEYHAALVKGRPAMIQTTILVDNPDTDAAATASDSAFAEDTSNVGRKQSSRVVYEKKLDANGNEIRLLHDYIEYGITVSSAIIEKMDPDDMFEEQIQKRKDAAARRIVAKEQRLEQEELRLLKIAEGERMIAERQAEAKTEQIQKTTEAETKKKLALIEVDRIREEARVSRETAQIILEKSKVDAEAIKVTADARAFERTKLLEADNALQLKLDAEIQIQKVWAEAYAKRQVPGIVMGGCSNNGVPVGSDSEVQDLLKLLTAQTAKSLSYDRNVLVAPKVPN